MGTLAKRRTVEHAPRYLGEKAALLNSERSSLQGAFDRDSEENRQRLERIQGQLERLDRLSEGQEMEEAWRSLRRAAGPYFDNVAQEVVQTCLEAPSMLDQFEQLTTKEIRDKASEAMRLANELAKYLRYLHLRDIKLFDLLPDHMQELICVDLAPYGPSTIAPKTTRKTFERRAKLIKSGEARERALFDVFHELPLHQVFDKLARLCGEQQREALAFVDQPRMKSAATQRLIHELSLLMYDRLKKPLYGFVAKAVASLHGNPLINEDAVRAYIRRHPDEFPRKS